MWDKTEPTSVDNVALMQVVNCIEDLANRLRRILLCELAVFANPVEQLTTSGQLGNDVEFVLNLG